MPAPVGAVIVIVPVALPQECGSITEHAGCDVDYGDAFTSSPVSAVELAQVLLAVTE